MAHNHDHAGGHARAAGRALTWSVVLTLGFAAVEFVGGWWGGSLALMGDAGHMVTDALALAMGAVAARLSQAPPSRRHTFGLKRAEVVGALINAVFMVAVVAWLGYEAIQRLLQPVPVAGPVILVIAAVGLGVNLLVLRVLHGGEQTLNTRGAILHVMGDLLGSVAALASGLVVTVTGWTPIDPLLSLLISALILISTIRLLADALHVVMEGVPGHVRLSEVAGRLTTIDGVIDVHDLHVWTIASGTHAISAHVRIRDLQRWPELLVSMERLLNEEFHIDHVTLQPEPPYQVALIPASGLRPGSHADSGG